MNNTTTISKRFARARDSYDKSAVAQREISDKLFRLLKPHSLNNNKILELGCGTGNLSLHLSTLGATELIINDLYHGYIDVLAQKLEGKDYRFKAQDARDLIKEIGSKDQSFDLIASSSAIQWLDSPINFLQDCTKLLTKGGIIAISTFAEGNIEEVTSISGNGLHYPDLEEYKEMAESGNCEILHLTQEEITINFGSAFEILSHLKQSGVTASNSSKKWTKGDLMQFVGEYNRRYRLSDSRCPLTYKPIYLVCRKR